MTAEQNNAPFREWEEHLEELRKRLLSILAVFFLASAAAFFFSGRIAALLMAPLEHFDVRLYTFSPAEKFMAYLHLSVWTGVLFSTPFFCTQTALFLKPGLKKSEFRYALLAFVVAPILFLAGAAISYRFFAPIVFGFFLGFASGDGVEPLWGLREYLALLFDLMLALGISLQMPLLLLVLMAANVVSPDRLAKYRPHIVLVIFTLAAFLTPPDVASQVMMGVPLYLLFEATLFLGRLMKR